MDFARHFLSESCIAKQAGFWYKAAPKKSAGMPERRNPYGKKQSSHSLLSNYLIYMATKKKTDLLIHGVAPYKPRKNEEYMGPAQIEHFRKILEGWLTELKSETSRTVGHMQDETANHPDPTDRATQETDMALELRGRDRDRKLIKKIEDSIIHLNSGDFGFCENCGEDIGLKRLEARPTASLCIDCKTIAEIREKQLS